MGALLFAITLSALLNKTVLHFTKQFKRVNDKGEKRLSNKNISPFGPKYNDSNLLNSCCFKVISSSLSCIRSFVNMALSFAKSVFNFSIYLVFSNNF